MNYTMKELPETQRPYEKCSIYGCEALSDAELLAIILRTGTGGMTSVDLACEILQKIGSDNLSGLYKISVPELCQIKGIGRVKALQIKCIAELSKRIAKSAVSRKQAFHSALEIAEYYMEDFRHSDQEHVLVVSFNTKGYLLNDKVITKGTVNQSLVTPREVYLEAMHHHAAYIVLLHNHPSGDAAPSQEDFYMTERIADAGQIIGIPLMDHIILGDRCYYSFCEHHTLTDEKEKEGTGEDYRG